ncbi:transposase [Endozoicomonas sp. 4G]|uniref:transposase n=1 Tax=Endozoicomonas sp. 4G TaxID=2872754 RepID=UPI002078F320|nr:transposase [Endozoicomonas sp. 4G]
MLTADHRVILRELAFYTTFLAGALSPTAVPTFCELLFGCLLSGDGFVTQSLLSIDYQRLWSSYHHWISHGKWRWKDLSRHLIRLVCSKVPSE